MTGAQHVTVAVSRNPENAAPIAGTFQGPPGCAKGIVVGVTVTRVDAAPDLDAPPVPLVDLWKPPASVKQSQPMQQAQQVAQVSSPAPAMEMVIKPTSAALPPSKP